MLALSSTTLAQAGSGVFATGPNSSFDPYPSSSNARQPGEIVIVSRPRQTSATHNAELAPLLAGDDNTPGVGGNSLLSTLPAALPYTFIGVQADLDDRATRSLRF